MGGQGGEGEAWVAHRNDLSELDARVEARVLLEHVVEEILRGVAVGVLLGERGFAVR